MLQAVEVHDGPPHGPAQTRVAVIQNHAARTWAVTARVIHPGIGMADGGERDRFGAGLSELLERAARTELIDELLLLVRTVPDDGAERDLWLARHRRPTRPALARQVERRTPGSADRRGGAHRSVRDRRGPREHGSAASPGARRRPRRPRPGPVRADGRGRGAAARRRWA